MGLRIRDFWVEGLRKKIFLFQVLGFVSKMDFGVLMCVLVAMVDVKRWWVWILECLAVVSGSFVDFSRFMDLIWVFWVVLGGLLCGWWWVLVFCWDCSGGSIVFFFFFFVWVMALWVMLAGSNGKSMEEWRRFVKQNSEMEEMREIFFFF